MDRWEYLVSHPYQVRLRVAEHFLDGHNMVVEVGPYRTHLNLPNTPVHVAIDPLGSVGWAEQTTVSQWWAEHGGKSGFGLCCLGLALEGSRVEWDALVEMARAADRLVLEWAADYQHQFGDPMTLTAGRRTLFHATFTLPDTTPPGFPVYPRRHMVVAE